MSQQFCWLMEGLTIAQKKFVKTADPWDIWDDFMQNREISRLLLPVRQTSCLLQCGQSLPWFSATYAVDVHVHLWRKNVSGTAFISCLDASAAIGIMKDGGDDFCGNAGKNVI